MAKSPTESKTAKDSKSRKRYAVIDIGSNATRLNIGVMNGGEFISETFARVPLALGEDAFSASRRIRRPRQKRLRKAVGGMRGLIDSMAPVVWQAVATAALRAASNRAEVLGDIERDCGVAVRVLSGEEEAELVGEFVAAQFAGAVLNLDVGGGSSDCALVVGGRVEKVGSFAVGTARDLRECGDETRRMRQWLRDLMRELAGREAALTLSASGGNVRKIAKLCPLDAANLARERERVRAMSVARRMAAYDLTADKARRLDSTLALYLDILAVTGGEIHPVKGGLAESIIHRMAR